MRILFIIHTPKDLLTAVYGNTVGRAAFLERQGHEVTIWTPEDFSILKHLPGRLLPLIYPISLAFRLMRHVREYDLLNFHSYTGWLFNLCRRLIPAGVRPRTMTTFHGLEPLYYDKLKSEMKRIGRPLSLRYRLLHGALMPRLIRLSCRRSDLVACLNRTEAAYLITHSWSHESRVVITPNGISDDFFIERQWKAQARQILFVGQWQERKGIRCLVEAFSQLVNTEPELHLWCVGTLVDEEVVLSAFPDKIRQHVTVRPRVTQDELREIYKAADLFVFPSLFEGFSIALLEAMASALPIITTRVGAAPDILEAGVSALFVPENDTMALADAMRRTIADAPLRQRLGYQAQFEAIKYKYGEVYQNYLKLLEDSLAGISLKECEKTVIELS